MARGRSDISRVGRTGSSAVLLNQVLKPALRAYAFGHISTTGPKLAGLLLALIGGKSNLQRHIEKLKYITRSSLGLFRFPFFCASIVGLYSSLSLLFSTSAQRWISSRTLSSSHPAALSLSQIRVARFLAALIASWVTFPMLNRGDARVVRRRAVSDVPVDPTMAHLAHDPQFAAMGHPTAAADSAALATSSSSVSARYSPGGKPAPPLAGRTMDLTVRAAVRGTETLIWHWWRRRYSHSSSKVVRAIAASSDSALFIGSCFVIMWSWFYTPLALPASYRRWIGQAAGVNPRLVEVLRKARWGTWVYGVDTGQGYVLEGMVRDLGLPDDWAEPARTVPLPCEVVHQGTGASCHWHKAVKFAGVWQFAMRMYLPLQLALRLRGGKVNLAILRRCFVEANRSSAFLAAFVSLFYYGVCLARTLVGPRLFSTETVSRQMWDGGLCVGAGSALCGWSVLIEPPRRRQELALFVAPRAASCFVPARYERKYLSRERAAFAYGVAVLFALGQENPANVRGIIGSLIKTVLG